MFEQSLKEAVDFISANPIIAYYIAIVAMVLPLVKIYKRAGFSPKGVIWLLLPFFGYLVTLGLLVFRPWPVLPPRVKRVKKETV